MIDTHAHIHGDSFAEDRADVVARAKEAGVSQIVTVGCDLPDSQAALEAAREDELADLAPHARVSRADVGGFHALRRGEDRLRGLLRERRAAHHAPAQSAMRTPVTFSPDPLGAADGRMPPAASATQSRSSHRRDPSTATLSGPMNSQVTAAPKDPANWLAYADVAIKADDAQAKAALRAWLRLAQELHQDGYYTFAIVKDSLKVHTREGKRTASGNRWMRQGTPQSRSPRRRLT